MEHDSLSANEISMMPFVTATTAQRIMALDSSDGQKPRLLVITSMFPRWHDDAEPGFVFELCRRLTDRFDVRVLAPHARGAAEHENMFGVDVVRYRYCLEVFETLAYGGGIVPKLRKQPLKWLLVPFFLVAQYRMVRRQIKRWNPDAVHAHWIIPQGVIAAFARGQKHRSAQITTSHGTDMFAFNRGWLKRLKRYALDRSEAVTVVGAAMREIAIDLGIAAEKISVSPMGVDLRTLFVADPNSTRSNDEILFVGRLAETKGLRFLLDALPQILHRHPSASVTIVGFGPERDTLFAQAKALGIQDRVAFVGPVPHSELPKLYRRASVFVAPFVRVSTGEQEGFGLVIIEAMGCACPVVVSAAPAMSELVDGHIECLSPSADADALAGTILKVLDDPAAAAVIAKQLRDSALARFDWCAVATSYTDLINRTIRTRSETMR